LTLRDFPVSAIAIAIEKGAESAYISPKERSRNRRGFMPMELSSLETELLVNLLEKELEEIRSERHHTQGHGYKDTLKERELLVRGLLAKLKA
jgi:hypothetical protein